MPVDNSWGVTKPQACWKCNEPMERVSSRNDLGWLCDLCGVFMTDQELEELAWGQVGAWWGEVRNEE